MFRELYAHRDMKALFELAGSCVNIDRSSNDLSEVQILFLFP